MENPSIPKNETDRLKTFTSVVLKSLECYGKFNEFPWAIYEKNPFSAKAGIIFLYSMEYSQERLKEKLETVEILWKKVEAVNKLKNNFIIPIIQFLSDMNCKIPLTDLIKINDSLKKNFYIVDGYTNLLEVPDWVSTDTRNHLEAIEARTQVAKKVESLVIEMPIDPQDLIQNIDCMVRALARSHQKISGELSNVPNASLNEGLLTLLYSAKAVRTAGGKELGAEGGNISKSHLTKHHPEFYAPDSSSSLSLKEVSFAKPK